MNGLDGVLLLGGEEVSLVEESVGLRVGPGLEGEAGAEGFWLGGERSGGLCGDLRMVRRGWTREHLDERAEFGAEGGKLVAAVGFLADGLAYIDCGCGHGGRSWSGS